VRGLEGTEEMAIARVAGKAVAGTDEVAEGAGPAAAENENC
jgi:hypothetical protein